MEGAARLRAHFSPIEREEISRLKKIVKDQERENHYLKKALEMREALYEVETPKAIRVKVAKAKRPKAFQLHLSDTHSREIVTLSQTGGRNEHNPEIGRERLRSIILQTIDEIKKEAKYCTPTHLTVWGGGDWMANADLHYKMERCVDDEPLVEMRNVYKMLKEELGLLWANTPTDSNSFVGSFSNHGRDSERMVLGFEAARSYDTAIYERLEEDFGDVEFILASTPWTVETVGQFKTLYTHGHVKRVSNVKRNSDGIMVPKWTEIRNMRTDNPFDAWVQGHHHARCILWSEKFCHMQNGCLVGENSYSHAEGYPPEAPTQNLAVIDLESNRVERVVTLYA